MAKSKGKKYTSTSVNRVDKLTETFSHKQKCVSKQQFQDTHDNNPLLIDNDKAEYVEEIVDTKQGPTGATELKMETSMEKEKSLEEEKITSNIKTDSESSRVDLPTVCKKTKPLSRDTEASVMFAVRPGLTGDHDRESSMNSMASVSINMFDNDTSLRHEYNRFNTFVKYPQNAPLSSILLAHNGFVYVGNGDTDAVMCAFCKTIKSGWQENDDIKKVHSDLSSHCPLVNGIECGNKPVEADMIRTSLGALASKWFHHGRTSKAERKTHRSHNPSFGSYSGAARIDQQVSNQNNISTFAAVDKVVDNVPAVEETTFSNTSTQPPASERRSPVTQTEQVGTVGNEAEYDNSGTLVTSKTFCDVTSSAQQNTESGNVRRNVGIINGSSNNDQNASHHNVATISSASPVSSSPSRSSMVQGNVARPSNENTSNEYMNSWVENGSTSSNTSGSRASSTASAVSSDSRGSNGQDRGNTNNSNKPTTYEELSILTARPKRAEYAIKSNRLQSFHGWPSNHHLKPEDLSDAGFFYTGYSDTARCYYCGGGLRNWDSTDNVWVEHARWFPKCVFMRITKGQQFVDMVQEIHKEDPCEISYNDVMKRLSLNSCQEQDSLKKDPAVLALGDSGFLIDDVVSAAKTMKISGTPLTSDQLYEQLIKEKKPRRLKASSKEPSSKAASGDDVTAAVETMKEQNLELRQQSLCKICYDKEVGVVFLPCGHFVSCTDCAGAMKNCPVCRDDVKGLVRAFMT